MAACLTAVLLQLYCLRGAAAEPERRTYRIGFTSAVFKGQNETDILAALKVWAQTIVRERGIFVDPRMLILRSMRDCVSAVEAKQVDALALMLDEYGAFPRGRLSGPYFRPEIEGSVLEQYVVLARADGRSGSLAALRRGTLGVHDDVNASLSTGWLNAQLSSSGLGRLSKVFSPIERNPKLSAAVLGVFFGKYDAGLVSRRGFDSVAALNPQVSKRLAVIAASASVVPSLFCFRTGIPEADKRLLLDEILHLTDTVAGDQVLRVFKADRMSEVPPEQVRQSLDLLEQWSLAASGARRADSTPGGDGSGAEAL